MKLKLIHIIDKVEAVVLRHRFYFVCNLIGFSSWWGDHCCRASGCVKELND